MIFLIGGIQMKIKRISIYDLHDEYSYMIEFDSKLTFLFGTNGCGKTTVLNILTSIVTGKLYNLADYTFSKIQLDYIEGNDNCKKIEISIDKVNDTSDKMKIKFNNEFFEIEDISNLMERLFRKAEDENWERSFYDMYPFAEKIKRIFNYVYLPLNRYGNDNRYVEREYFGYINRRRYFIQQQNPYNTYLNESLQYISELIKNSCMNINVQENRINDKFRKDVLSSSISISGDMPIGKIIKEIENFQWDDVLKSKDVYIKTLNDIGVYDKNLQSKIEQFFEKFKKAYSDYQSNKSATNSGIRIDLAWQYAEFLKIKSVVELAKENEKKKEKVRKPKEIFLEVINDFFSSNKSDKRIKINSNGQVYFESHNKNLKLSDLSSGEKQIIITFASLIFGLEGETTGIFIVDEPEASLHLEWQSMFVPAILRTNKNVQLIFATHSHTLFSK